MSKEHRFTIEHIKGKQNCVPDCLSHYPVDPPQDYDDDEKQSKSTQTGFQQRIAGAVTTRRSNKQQRIAVNDTIGNLHAQKSNENIQESNSNLQSIDPYAQQLNQQVLAEPTNEIIVFTNEQLQMHQQQDDSIKKIIENINVKPFSDQYCLKDGLLCRNIRRFNGLVKVPVLPKNKMNDVLLAYHNTSLNGCHFGKEKTFYKIRDRYYWTGMYNDIARHIQSCPNCAINKTSRRKSNGHLAQVDPPQGVWENLSMDYLGPITPTSSTGHRYILIATDIFSKFVIAKPTKDSSAFTAAKALVEDVILKYGAPNQLLTNNGRHFTADIFNMIESLYGICHTYTTPYNPQANGVSERFNKSMCDTLATVCNSKRTNWDEQVSKVVFSYNTSPHSSTKLIPYELVFGRLPRLPFDLPKKSTTVVQPHEYAQQLEEYLQMAKQAATANIVQAQSKTKQRYDEHRTNEVYSVGDFVYLKQLGFNSKLAPKYNGPYQVIQEINPVIYRLQNPQVTFIVSRFTCP